MFTQKSIPETYETRTQFADRHGVSLRTVDNWLKEGRIPYRRITARCVRIPVHAAERALSAFDVISPAAGHDGGQA